MSQTGPGSGPVPSGATMQPQYMGRVMNTYPVSEPEMELVSSLSGQATARFSAASFLLGLAASIWVNAAFYESLTPEAKVASYFVAPLLLIFSFGFACGGARAQYKRGGEWKKIKSSSVPLQTVAPVLPVVVAAAEKQDGESGSAAAAVAGG